ncbi:MAG TPA: hypothetical protein VFD57_03255 [Clostridia bacterium]|nr:hypothetical protein [Clostridia bacterium]
MSKQKEPYGSNIPIIIIIVVSSIAILLAVIWILDLQNQNRQKAQELILEGIDIFFPKIEISALLYDGGYIWVGGRDGVFLIEPQKGEIVKELAKDIRMTYTAGICQTDDGKVWIGHENGISIFGGDKRIDFSPPDIPGGRVNTIIKEENGGVWAGTQTGAVHFVKKDDSYIIDKILTSKEGLQEDAVNAIGMDNDNGIWFGAYLSNKVGGISVLRDGEWQYFSTNQGLPHRYVTAIIPIGGEHMLVGVGHLDRGGMALFKQDDRQFLLETAFSMDDGLPGEKIRQLFLDSKEQLWITSESNGLLICSSYDELYHQQLSGGVYLTTKNGLSDNEVKTIIEAEGYYWMGSRYGLTRIRESTIEGLFLDNQ